MQTDVLWSPVEWRHETTIFIVKNLFKYLEKVAFGYALTYHIAHYGGTGGQLTGVLLL